MQILVTGDQGLIGRAVTARLREAGDHVVGFDRADGHDILDSAALARAAQGCAAIVHTAALLGRPWDKPDDIMTVNVTGTWNALAAARAAGARRVVAFSSVNALGIFSGNGTPDYLPIDDAHPARATTAYGISKRLGEEMCRCFTLDTGIPTICLRPPWVSDANRKAAELARRAANPEAEWSPFWEYGAWVDVRDLADAVHLALRCPDPGHMTALVVADDVASATPSMELAARLLPDTPWRGPPLPGPRAALVRSDAARRTFGWRPLHSWL
jgi:nucleoside-diphosphate-sugar epimerase